MKRQFMAVVIICCLFFSGCQYTTMPYLKGNPRKADTTDESGKSYCRRLADSTDATARANLTWGIILAIISGGGILAGSIMGPDTSDNANWAEQNRNAITIGVAGLLVLPATLLLMRSTHMSSASAEAGKAMSLGSDSEMMARCLVVRAKLLTDRNALAELAQRDANQRVEKTFTMIKEDKESDIKEKEKEISKKEEEISKKKEGMKQLRDPNKVKKAGVDLLVLQAELKKLRAELEQLKREKSFASVFLKSYSKSQSKSPTNKKEKDKKDDKTTSQ